jgi:hypothetical protein
MVPQPSVEAVERYPLSDTDIRKVLGKDCKIIRYGDLDEYQTLEQLLPKSVDYLVLLYEARKYRGHWVGILRYDDEFEFFDPYGLKPDKELLWTPPKLRHMLDQAEPYLTVLINRSDKDTVYNAVKYQEMNSKVNTCGSHVCHRIYRMLYNHMNLQEYFDFMKATKDKTGQDYDEIVATWIRPKLL